jgi:hypothetical protein
MVSQVLIPLLILIKIESFDNEILIIIIYNYDRYYIYLWR